MSDVVIYRLNEAELNRLVFLPEGPLGQHLLRVAIRVEKRAKYMSPVDTGRLRSSITHALFREDGELVAHIGTNVEYALFVELGTSRMSAQPFLRPALAAEIAGGLL